MKRIFLIFLVILLLFASCQATTFVPPVESVSDTVFVTDAPQTNPVTPRPSTDPSTTAPTETEPLTPLFDPIALANSLTIEERVGQLILARCPSLDAAEDVAEYHLGGYVLFGADFASRTPEQARNVIASYQAAASVPLLIAVDEEGGTVTRVSRYPQYRQSRFPSPRSLFAEGGLDALLEIEEEKCRLLSSLGINMNLAPVCDITTDKDALLYDRSLGQSPDVTAQVIAAMVKKMTSLGIGSALKHFPGYGNNADTHIGIAVDDRTLSELEACDLLPFQAGIGAGCGAVMVAHTIVTCLDDTLPASLSPAVHSYLREEMGYAGVILTDDLAMQAITDVYGDGEAAVLAVLAGNDLLCSSHYRTQYAAVLNAVRSGRISESRITESAARVLALKHSLDLLG